MPAQASVARQDTKLLESKGVSSSPKKNRSNVQSLQEWATSEAVGIQVASQRLELQSDESSGLGWYLKSPSSSLKPLDKGSVLLSVPSGVALTVQCPGDGPDDSSVATALQCKLADYPWFVQMALYLYKLDKIDATKTGSKQSINYRPWLDSLPRQFDTPFHWSSSGLESLQYPHMVLAVTKQQSAWRRYYDSLSASRARPTFDDFVWACECARSRAFSGTYTGNAFNPSIYAFTLLLVTVYVGLGLGTIEQAANGAGLVLAASVFKDFIVPKFFKSKRYVICPMIDMANHQSVGTTGEVAFEFFGNAYSLAISAIPSTTSKQLYISYGTRSNDQLLQYYGFIESNNPHDVYVMPPIREWDIGALEAALGRPFAPGRLEKLNRAGLLGKDAKEAVSDDLEDESADGGISNSYGGVVLNRVQGLDPAVLQALRALVSTEEQWNAAGQAIGNFAAENSGGLDNEQDARLVARTAVTLELSAKATTMEQDEELLRRMNAMKSMETTTSERLAIQFRMEKKKLLRDTIKLLE